MAIALDGVVNGPDNPAIIAAYRQTAGASTDVTRRMRSDLEAHKALLQDFRSRLASLRTFAEDTLSSGVMTTRATSSGEEVLTVDVGDGAQLGSFSVLVTSLAMAEMEMSQGYVAMTAEIGEGTVSVTIAGATVDIALSAAQNDNTLVGLKSAINEQVDGVAYLLDDGSGANPWRLVVTSDETGVSRTIEIDASGLKGGTAPVFTEAVSASDAAVQIGSQTIESSTNQFDDLLPGVTLSVSSLGTSQVTIEQNIEATIETVHDFVSRYNDVMSLTGGETRLDASGKPVATNGEAVLRTVQASLQRSMRSLLLSGDPRGAASIGVKIERDGSISLDDTRLEVTLQESPEDVIEILTGETGLLAEIESKLDAVVDEDTGAVAIRTESLDLQIRDLSEQIENGEVRLDWREETLLSQFTNLEMTLAELQSTGTFLNSLFVGIYR